MKIERLLQGTPVVLSYETDLETLHKMQKYLAKMDALNTPLEKFGDELYYALKADDEMQRTKKKGGG